MGSPIVRDSVGAIDLIVVEFGVDERADVFPDDVAFEGDFDEAAVRAFGDEGVAIREALDGADEDAVEPAVVDERCTTAIASGILPDDFECVRIEFDYA